MSRSYSSKVLRRKSWISFQWRQRTIFLVCTSEKAARQIGYYGMLLETFLAAGYPPIGETLIEALPFADLEPHDELTTRGFCLARAPSLYVLYLPDDKESYGETDDWGYYTGSYYQGYDNLPPGYWVYLHPYWYIWGNQR